MKRFATYLLIVILGTAALDGLNRVLIESAYAHLPNDSELKRTFSYATPCDAQFLILGASRGVYDYNTPMISDSLNVTCQSISMEGMSSISQYVSVKNAITCGKVKTILYDISISQLSDEWVENQMGTYYPFYWQNEDVRKIVDDMQGKKMKLLLSSSFIQYNSTLYDILYTGFVRKTEDKNGFIALPYTGIKFESVNPDVLASTMKINPIGVDYLQKTVDLCKGNGIRLIICDSPRAHYKNQSFDDFLSEFCQKNQIEFWNYSDYEPIVSDMRYFVDPVHINGKGADLFTKAIISRLKGE